MVTEEASCGGLGRGGGHPGREGVQYLTSESDFPDVLEIKILPGGVQTNTAAINLFTAMGDVEFPPSSARRASTTHSTSSPRTSQRGERVRKWRICSTADSTNTREGPKGRAGFLSSPPAKMAAGCFNLQPGSHAPASPPLPGSSHLDSRVCAAFMNQRVRLTASALCVGRLRSAVVGTPRCHGRIPAPAASKIPPRLDWGQTTR